MKASELIRRLGGIMETTESDPDVLLQVLYGDTFQVTETITYHRETPVIVVRGDLKHE